MCVAFISFINQHCFEGERGMLNGLKSSASAPTLLAEIEGISCSKLLADEEEINL